MCFSATASFIVGGVMTATGVATLKIAKPHDRLFAAIPILFGVQQVIEGFQWLAERPSAVCQGLGYGYLLFAFVVWPLYVPAAVYQIETNRDRKRILRMFMVAGAGIAIFLLGNLLIRPLEVLVVQSGIQYLVNVPYKATWLLSYVFVTCGCCVVCSDPYIRWFGVGLTISAFVSYFMFYGAFFSVWCFFAAALSIIVVARVVSRR